MTINNNLQIITINNSQTIINSRSSKSLHSWFIKKNFEHPDLDMHGEIFYIRVERAEKKNGTTQYAYIRANRMQVDGLDYYKLLNGTGKWLAHYPRYNLIYVYYPQEENIEEIIQAQAQPIIQHKQKQPVYKRPQIHSVYTE